MKKLLAMTAALSISAGSVMAAHPADGGKIVGQSKNADYPLLVLGTDNNEYICADEIVVKSGQNVRRCMSRSGGLFAGGMGSGAVFLVVLAGAAAAAAFSGGGNSSNGTN